MNGGSIQAANESKMFMLKSVALNRRVSLRQKLKYEDGICMEYWKFIG